MSHYPVKKCLQTFKLTIFLIIVVYAFALFEHWRGYRVDSAKYESQIIADEARIVPGLGEGGVAVYLDGEEKRLGDLSEKKSAMNVYLSDIIPYNRTLKDFRNPACANVVYDAELPSASVIIIFHNEPYSVVIRTIWNVINTARRDQPWHDIANYYGNGGKRTGLGYPGQDQNSPFVYLKEIILVDDNSTLPELKGKLDHYIRTRLPPDVITTLRLPHREGLIKARMAGAQYATGDVMIFLDSHCEGDVDWLRPLLQRIKDSPHSVLVPIIDVIQNNDFHYSVVDRTQFKVGGFRFTGDFIWIDLPEREKERRGSDIAPTWSPTMAGGLFAINRQYYWKLGDYDEQMQGWGGENLEMSFRIWQCGGTLETIPCSRIGHVFRKFHPYKLPAPEMRGINTARMAEVWMDEYAELFYLSRPDLRKNPKVGDVTHRKMLRQKLRCNGFQWYLDNIYKEKFVPVREAFAYGRIRNEKTNLCLDSMMRDEEGSVLGVYYCHDVLAATQYFTLALSGELRDEERCAEVRSSRHINEYDNFRKPVIFNTCNVNDTQLKWRYVADSQQIQHIDSGLCLEATQQSGSDAIATKCENDNQMQKWTIDFSELNGFTRAVSEVSTELQEILRKIREGRR